MNKQIEEMAKAICHTPNCKLKKANEPCYKYCKAYIYAFRATNAGYRKQSEGEWKLGKSGCMYFCSSCGYAAHSREEEEWNFCPNCGARMKGEKEDA